MISYPFLLSQKVNIFVDEYRMAKIADFGLAIITEATTGGSEKSSTSSPKGTVAWMSPERNHFDGCVPRLSPAMDVYSFGMLCLAVCPLCMHYLLLLVLT
jgi:serine/threonine protein kinase